jgi:NAD(P)-dependent dehydrogenase (short-subunit alcohol dehydrogenase family)
VRLVRGGWRVLVGVRTPGGARDGTEEILLDVTDADHVAGAAAAAGDELHALVDNAGIALGAPLELIPIDELRRQLEMSVVAQVAVTQAVLPALRRARRRPRRTDPWGPRTAAGPPPRPRLRADHAGRVERRLR